MNTTATVFFCVAAALMLLTSAGTAIRSTVRRENYEEISSEWMRSFGVCYIMLTAAIILGTFIGGSQIQDFCFWTIVWIAEVWLAITAIISLFLSREASREGTFVGTMFLGFAVAFRIIAIVISG